MMHSPRVIYVRDGLCFMDSTSSSGVNLSMVLAGRSIEGRTCSHSMEFDLFGRAT